MGKTNGEFCDVHQAFHGKCEPERDTRYDCLRGLCDHPQHENGTQIQ